MLLGQDGVNKKISGEKKMAAEVRVKHKRHKSEDDEEECRQSKSLKTDGNSSYTTCDSPYKASATNDNPATPDLKIQTPAYTDSGYGSVATSSTKLPASNASSTSGECGTPLAVNLAPNSTCKVKKRILCKFGPSHLKKFLQRNFIRLKDEVNPKEIADYLLEDGVISVGDNEYINEVNRRRQQVDILIKAIVKSKVINDVNTTKKVLEAFEKTGQEHLFKDFDDDIPDDVKLPKKVIKQLTEKDVRRVITSNWALLKEEIDPLSVIDSLLERRVLEFDEHENILTIDYKKDKMTCLCKYILDKPIVAFWHFCQVLKNSTYTVIGKQLLKEGNDTISDHPLSPEEMDLQLTDPFSSTTNDISNTGHSLTEIHFNLGSKEVERMIVDDYESSGAQSDLSPKAMEIGYDVEGVSFSSIKIKLKCLTEQSHLNLIRRSEHSLLYIKKILKTIITQEHLKKMREETIKQIDFKVLIYPPQKGEARCLCKLKKEDVVKHFSLIEKRIAKVGEIVEQICQSLLVDDREQKKWLDSKNDVDAFLRLIINGEDSLVCLLEKLLRSTDQIELLEMITARAETKTTPEITADDIKQHRHQLVDEIEPRKFVDMLREIPNSDDIVDTVMRTEIPRLKRSKALVTFILKTKSEKIFQQELEKQQMFYLTKLLTSSIGSLQDLKEAVVASLDDITENIEPARFKKYLVIKPDMCGKEFKNICRHTARKRRAFALMEKIIHGPDILIRRFINGLNELDYGGISKLIQERAETYKECARLHETTIKEKMVIFRGRFDINYETCGKDSETQLEVYLNLHNLMSEFCEESADDENDTSKDPVKDARISAWVIQQHAFIQQESIAADMEDDKQNNKEFEDPVADVQEGISHSAIAQNLQPCGISEETRTTVSSQAPTTNVSSPLSSQYEDITPPSSPVQYQNTRAYKRRHSLLDEEECSSRSSGSPEERHLNTTPNRNIRPSSSSISQSSMYSSLTMAFLKPFRTMSNKKKSYI
ncbi:uncharacterized protein LOC127881091 isoform X2 [Dreissena polymorpha]|uniref:uncharacterized protein LOC127881091 isoform X2 n=1 Tax=Dreissena polymorpha TaxID=45954 RepID=UPI0022648DA7|nr:uncharacterized protein LOC127881091 isoform X2 [Dreissena polymorpha]